VAMYSVGHTTIISLLIYGLQLFLLIMTVNEIIYVFSLTSVFPAVRLHVLCFLVRRYFVV
jgi:hypothetical protein